MSTSKDKKFRQTFNKNFKEELTEAAKKIVDEKVTKHINELKADKFYIARQRDIMFLLNIGFLISNIVFIILWLAKH